MNEGKPAGKSGCKIAFIVILVIVGLFVALIAAGGIFVWQNKEQMGSQAVEFVLTATLEQAKFPAAEREAVMQPIRDLAARVQAGEISMEQVAKISMALTQGPTFAALVIRGIEFSDLGEVDLSGEEAEKARVTLSRFNYGLLQGEIGKEALDPVLAILSLNPESRKSGNVHVELTAEKMRSCLDIMKTAADAAQIEDRRMEVDLAAAIQQTIDRELP